MLPGDVWIADLKSKEGPLYDFLLIVEEGSNHEFTSYIHCIGIKNGEEPNMHVQFTKHAKLAYKYHGHLTDLEKIIYNIK